MYDLLPLLLASTRCPDAKMYDLLPLLWSRSGAPILRCAICCSGFGLEVVPQFQDVRFVDVALASRWCPNAKMYDLLPLLWSRSGAPMLRCAICCRGFGACTICCRCFGLEVVPQFQDVRFVAVALASRWCPNAKMYDLLPLLWSRSGAPILRCAICCSGFGLEVVPQFQDVRFVDVALVSKWCPNAKMYDLLPLLWSRSGAPMLRCTICVRGFGLEVVPQFQDVRFVAVALVSKWCPNAKMYDLLPLLWSRSGVPNAKMHDVLPLLWSRSGAPMKRCTICCFCFGLEVVPQC